MDTVTVLYRGHILELDPAIVKALIRQAEKADLGPAERGRGLAGRGGRVLTPCQAKL